MRKVLLNGDCLNCIPAIKELVPRKLDCIIMDPPDNLGLKYNQYYDKRPDYYEWLYKVVKTYLPLTKVLWISYYYKHDVMLKCMLYNWICSAKLNVNLRTFIWRFAFGQYREGDAPNGYRPILRISHSDWKPIMEERVPSLREKVGDNRATGLGRVPDDVIDTPRITGNNSERRSWHCTQHSEAVYRRLIRMSLPMVNNRRTGTLLDPFGGTGTCFRCTWDDMLTIGIEIDPFYCEKIAEEHGLLSYRPNEYRSEDAL